MNPDVDKSILVSLHSEHCSQLHLLKKQEWSAVNYAVLLNVAIVTVAKNYITHISCCDAFFFIWIIIILTILFLCFVRNTLKNIQDTREIIRRILESFPEWEKKIDWIKDVGRENEEKSYLKSVTEFTSPRDWCVILPIYFIIIVSAFISIFIIANLPSC